MLKSDSVLYNNNTTAWFTNDDDNTMVLTYICVWYSAWLLYYLMLKLLL